MALAKQFYSSFKSYNDWDYYLEIWVEGYSGSASEISIGAGGPVITYGTDEQDRFSPILSSKLELPFMVTNTTQDAFIKNIREQFNEQDVYIHLYRASSSDYSLVAPLWSGFVLMDLSASPDLYYPYPVTLTAVDGLSLLKEIDFSKSGTAGSYTDSDMYSSNGRFTYWLKEILLKSGASTTTQGSTQDYKFTTAINWFNSVMPTITQSTDPFYQTKCNTKMFFSKDSDENFTVVNCYDVLKNLLKHWGARIIYWKHIYYIVQIQEYNTAESGTYANPDNIDTRTYTKTGAFDSSSDNLGDSYWTRYNLLIDSVEGGIQKLTGTDFNYLPQLKRTQAKFIDYGNKNYFGGLPYDLTTGQTDVIYQDTISDVSVDGSMILIIPLDVTMDVAYSGTLAMSLTFRMYITDGSTTYYLRYDASNTPKYYWENATTANLNFKKTIWRSNLDNIVGTQTKVGFHQQIEFKDVSGSALTLTGDWDIYTDIDNWGSNSGSFKFLYAQNGLFNTQVIHTPSSSTIYWTNTLNPNYQTPLNPSVIGQTNQPTSYNPNYSLNPTTSNSIVSYTSQLNTNPFEGKLLIVNASSSGALYGSFVSVSPNPITKDSEIVDFGDLIWGDTLLASSEGSLKVWNGSAFVKSNVIGTWGLGSTSGTNSYTEMLLSEYLYGQTKVIESPSMRLVTGETNKNQNDGSGSRPNYINPIGRLRGYSATGTTPYYIFKSGSFHLLKDEVDYQGYQIIRDTQSLTKTDDIIIGPDILQDKTNKIGQKTPQTNTLVNKLTQNSYITTVSAIKSAYGNDVAVNGIFASDSGWTKGTGWSISSNKAVFSPTGSTSDIKQDTLTNALTYKIIVTLTLSAGGLSVKAGSSGNSTVLSASGTYEIFSTCAGSTDVIFEASAAFEGYIEKVVVQQQVPVTSININAIGTAVFKTNDVLNVADVDGDDVIEFTVSSDQGASDTSISVTSKLITEDILEGSIILVNQNDLAAQYQNKTKGTVAGFDITATGIAKSSINITDWLNSDTMSGAAVTNVPTALSVKNYVDGQVGASDTLQEVTDNGNTTTNSITFAGGTSTAITTIETVTDEKLVLRVPSGDSDDWNYIAFKGSNGVRDAFIGTDGDGDVRIFSDKNNGKIDLQSGKTVFDLAGSEKMRLTSAGDLGIGTTSPSEKLEVVGSILIEGNSDSRLYLGSNIAETFSFGTVWDGSYDSMFLEYSATATKVLSVRGNGNIGIGTTTASEKLHVVGDALITGDSMADAFKPAATGEPIKFKNFGSTELARITDGGNVLIGTTTNYGEKLQINGSITISDIGTTRGINRNNDGYNLKLIGGVTTTSSAYIEINGGSRGGVGHALNGKMLLSTGSTYQSSQSNLVGDYFFQTQWDGGSTTLMKIISSNGNVLIGTTTDDGSSKLQVAGDIALTNNNTSLLGKTTGGSNLAIFKLDSSNNFQYGSIYAGASSIMYTATDFLWYTYPSSVLSQKMTLKQNGNLLIGTTTDSGAKLNVAGTTIYNSDYYQAMRVCDATDISKGIHIGYDATLDKGIIQAGNFGVAYKSLLLNPNFGSVLIGTTTDAGYKLDVFLGSTNGTIAHFTGNNAGRGLEINTFQSTNHDAGVIFNAKDTSHGLFTFETGGSEKMRLTSGGNLGIGTNNPEAVLEIESSSANLLKLYRTNSSAAAESIISFDFNNASAVQTNYAQIRADVGISTDGSHDGILQFHTAESGTVSEKMRLTSGGNLLIGTTTDSGAGNGNKRLQVVSPNSKISATFGIANGATGDYTGIGLVAAGNEVKAGLFFEDTASFNRGSLHFANRIALDNDVDMTLADSKMSITSAGNVLIGTTTDSGAKLNVQGSLQVGVDDTGYDVTFYGATSGEYLQWDASDDSLEFRDNVKAKFGNSGDLRIYHNATNSVISNLTGHLYIQNAKLDSDIVFQCDDGLGGVTSYITLDGSQTTINLEKNVLIGTTTNSGLYKIDVAGKARVQSVLELDDVLTLNQISTPSDPASGQSSIYMDSADGAIKVKINVGGTVVTRTIASFE